MSRNLIRISWLDIQNPVEEVMRLGYNIIQYELFGIGDCVIFELDRMPDPLPEHWYIVSQNFKFTGEK